MADALGEGRPPPWLDVAAPSARRPAVSPLVWFAAALVLAAVAVAAFLLGRSSDRRPTVVPYAMEPINNGLPPANSAMPPPPPVLTAPPALTAPGLVPRATDGATTPGASAPALARIADQAQQEAAPHPQPEQIRAASRLAEARRLAVQREEAAAAQAASPIPAPPPLPPRTAVAPPLAPPGRVVQLGTYSTTHEAEAAAKLFGWRYRGLLADLPKSVTPYRRKGVGRLTYRVQFVAPSQAYAEVTCQRIRAAGKSCAVIY